MQNPSDGTGREGEALKRQPGSSEERARLFRSNEGELARKESHKLEICRVPRTPTLADQAAAAQAV